MESEWQKNITFEQCNIILQLYNGEHAFTKLRFGPVHEISNIGYVRPAKPQISLRIHAV